MDDIAIFGEVYQGSRRRSFDVPSVRRYMGEEIPWVIHDCDDHNGCSFCRRQKREFIAAKKQEPKP